LPRWNALSSTHWQIKERAAAKYCACDDSFVIGPSRTGIFKRSWSPYGDIWSARRGETILLKARNSRVASRVPDYFLTFTYTFRRQGRGNGVGRGRGVGGGRVAEGVGDTGGGVIVAVAVAVAVGVGLGDPQGLTGQLKISSEAIGTTVLS
jgi:hypothetical protein